MLAKLFNCLKGCDGHSKGCSARIETTGSRRNLPQDGPASAQLSDAPSSNSCSSGVTVTLGSLAIAKDTARQQRFDTAGSSSLSTAPRPNDAQNPKQSTIQSIIGLSIGPELRSYCGQAGAPSGLPAISTLSPGSTVLRPTDAAARSPTPPMLFSLRHLHMALLPADYATQQHSPFTSDSPSGDLRPSSSDFVGLGFGGVDLATSDSSDPLSASGLHPQLRFVNACRLGEEVQDLQLLGRGGYGMVLTGNWRQEGRVAVKVLLSDEDKWMESCYKEAVLSKMLAHPNILQTYDFQVAVLTSSDVSRARVSWEQQQAAALQRAAALRAAAEEDPLACSATRLPYADLRADSFELLPPLYTASGAAGDCGGGADRAPGTSPTAIDLWQVLFMLGARAGQFVTLIIMEYAEVGTLQRAIAAGAFRESARLSRWAALRSLLVTAKEIAGGMCLLHSYKIIHGDISATNVMLRASRIDKRGFVAKVADFGLSKVTLSGVARTADWAGQVQYLAPECLDREARLASDVFAFGVLLFEMATGRKAFGEYQPAQILAGRLAGDLQLAWPEGEAGGEGEAAVAPGLRALAERCMRTDPEERPSFREVVEELRRQDAEAKAQHRQHSARRRFTADGLSASAALASATAAAATATAATGVGVGSNCRVPSLLGPHRFTTGQYGPQTAAAAAHTARSGAMAAAGSGPTGCLPPPRGQYGIAGGPANGHSPLRHSFTTGSTGLTVAGGCGGGDVRRVTASSSAAAAAAAVPVGAADTLSEFTGPAALQSVSSRTLGYCQSQSQLQSECSGRLCTAQYGDTALLSCDKASPLEPISSGVMFQCAGPSRKDVVPPPPPPPLMPDLAPPP